MPATSDREKLLAALYVSLLEVRKTLFVEEEGVEGLDELPAADWIAAVETIEASVQLRNSGAGGRDYLDYIQDFLTSGRI